MPVGNGDIRVVYTVGDDPYHMRSRVRDTAGVWGVERTLPALPLPAQWIQHRFLPNGGELIVTQETNTSKMQINAMQRSGNTWSLAWSEDGTGSEDWSKRTFDVEVEAVTGNAMVVFADGDENPGYRYWNGTQWSSAADVFGTSAPDSDLVEWVDLAADPSSRKIGLAYSDDESNQNLHAILWNGTSWDEAGTEFDTLETNLQTTGRKSFGVEFESNSGDMFVAWGGQSDGFYFAELSGSSNTWSGPTQYRGYSDDDKMWLVEMSAHPSED